MATERNCMKRYQMAAKFEEICPIEWRVEQEQLDILMTDPIAEILGPETFQLGISVNRESTWQFKIDRSSDYLRFHVFIVSDSKNVLHTHFRFFVKNPQNDTIIFKDSCTSIIFTDIGKENGVVWDKVMKVNELKELCSNGALLLNLNIVIFGDKKDEPPSKRSKILTESKANTNLVTLHKDI